MKAWAKIACSAVAVLVGLSGALIVFAYATLTCGEYDPCGTGDALPNATAWITGAFAIILASIAFLAWIWHRRSFGEGD